MTFTPQRPLGRYPLDHPDAHPVERRGRARTAEGRDTAGSAGALGSGRGSIPASRAAVEWALNLLDLMPGGRAAATPELLSKLGRGMRPQDFAALTLVIDREQRRAATSGG